MAPSGFSVSASSEGSLLYVQQSSAEIVNEMAWVDRSGKPLGVVGPGRAGLSQATLSPDGRRVAFAAGALNDGDIWVRDLERGTETRLTFGGEDDWAPTWLPPTRIAYVQMAGPSGGVSGRILAVNADGSGGQQVIVPEVALGAAMRAPLAVAPGGRIALQIVDERGHGRLRVAEIQSDGRLGAPQRILRIDPEPDVGEARVSPDGRLLAWVTDNPGSTELFLTRFPSGEGRWQVTTEAARDPRWARDTGELLFSAGLRQDTLFSVEVDPARDPPLGSPSELFRLDTADRPGSSYRYGLGDIDVTADGQRLLVVRPGGATARRMVLVQDWLAEFRQAGGR